MASRKWQTVSNNATHLFFKKRFERLSLSLEYFNDMSAFHSVLFFIN